VGSTPAEPLGNEKRMESEEPKPFEFTSDSRDQSMPPSWGSAAQWVDFKLIEAGLDPDARPVSEDLESPWGRSGFPQPETNPLWPHRALEEHRTRPFVAHPGASKPEAQAKTNMERLSRLWMMGSTHGVSWDDLDAEYVAFAAAGRARYDDWARRDAKGCVRATQAKAAAMEAAKTRMKRYNKRDAAKMKESGVDDVLNPGFQDAAGDPLYSHPTRTRVLASKLYAREKKNYLGDFRPGRLSYRLQQLVVARMLQRETAERAFTGTPNVKTGSE